MNGFLVGLLLGLLLGIVSGMMWERWGQGPREAEPVQNSELAALRLEWQDAQDKIFHLYDRVRKRARLRDETSNEQPGDTSNLNTLTKEQLRAYARTKGMM